LQSSDGIHTGSVEGDVLAVVWCCGVAKVTEEVNNLELSSRAFRKIMSTDLRGSTPRTSGVPIPTNMGLLLFTLLVYWVFIIDTP
jgi:hypothetical protein